MRAKTVLVTGSSDGHGRRVALELARRGWRVLLHGRDRARGEEALAAAGDGGHELLLADLGSLAAARRLAAEAGAVDLLVNNAGIISAERRESDDGIELTFAVNYLAHVALTEALLASDAPPSRVVNVASIGQAPIDWDDPLLARSYAPYRAYAQSKLAQILWTFDLAARGVRADALHPATLMDTTMVRGALGAPRSTVEEGAAATLRLIDDEDGSGRYFEGEREARADPVAYDPAERERLRALTARLLGG